MFDFIFDTFSGLTPMLWVSQILGLIGLVIVAISYQFDKRKFWIISSISYLFFIGEQMFAVLYVNALITFASLVRNIGMLIYNIKKGKPMEMWQVLVFLVSVWTVLIIFMATYGGITDWSNYLPPVIFTCFTLLMNSKNYYVLKLGAFIQEGGFLIYYSIFLLPFSILRQAILTGSVIISVIIMLVRSKKMKRNVVLNEIEKRNEEESA